MKTALTRRGFIRLTGGGLMAGTLGYRMAHGAEINPDADITQRLASFGGKFRFAILADIHLGHPDNHDTVPMNALNNLKTAVSEINAMSPAPAFVVHIGDLGNVPDTPSLDNWLAAVQPLQPLSLMVHGNHDGYPPYDQFKSYEEKVNRHADIFYSFDCGAWHFVVIPCNLNANNAVTKSTIESMIAFLERDLAQNSHRPTIVLQHLHFMTVGLTQTEWYLFHLDLRKRLRALYTKYGNVRWAFNGHVHNGVKASIKTSWNYQGINFVNCPNIIIGRPYGEEVPGFEEGLKQGGYYVVIEVDGEKVHVQGRLAGVPQAYDYPGEFQVFTDAVEPRLFHQVGELPASPELVNGNFADGLKGWMLPFRYKRDDAGNPIFTADVIKRDDQPGENALLLATHAAGESLVYAGDEYYEAAQICPLMEGKSPLVSVSYQVPEEPVSGGGYIRLELLRGLEYPFLMMFRWGSREDLCVFFPLAVGYALTGTVPGWTYFPGLVRKKKGFFWKIPSGPGQWRQLQVDVADLYDKAMDRPGSFFHEKPDKIRVVVGTWNNKTLGTSSRAAFGGISLRQMDAASASTLDGQELAEADPDVPFGLCMEKHR